MNARAAWGVAIACAVAVTAACVVWIRQNPLPSYYDEALYAIYALIDVWAWKTYGLAGAFYAMQKVDPFQPPGLRLVALPFTLAAAPALTFLRAISLAGWLASIGITAVSVRRVAGSVAAACSIAFTVALPIAVLSCRMFHTEYALFLAVALLLLGLTAKRSTALFAASVGLGLLAKASYLIVAAPMLVVAAIILPAKWRAMAIGAAIGCALAAPWWSENFSSAMNLLSIAGRNVRHAHGRWLYELLRCNFGFGIAAIVALCLFVAIRRRLAPSFALICAAGAVPLMLMHAAAVGHNPRHIAVPTALLAVAAAAIVPSLTPRQQALALALAAGQVAVMVFPMPRANDSGSYIWRGVSEVMDPVPQWNWTRLRQFADSRGFPRPRIAMLGEGYAFNAPQVRCAWPDLRGEVPVETLYEWTDHKPVTVEAMVERSSMAQLAMTPAGLRGEGTDGQVPNNRFNAAYAAALARDPRFEGPHVIDVGVRRPALIQVFVRR